MIKKVFKIKKKKNCYIYVCAVAYENTHQTPL